MDAGQRQGSAVARLIWVAGSPILFTLGVVGNVITIIVLTSKHNKMTSTSLYLIALAIADLVVMTLVQPRWWLIYTFGIDVRYLSNMACKTQWFITYISGVYSTLILVVMTIERVISTVKPYKVKNWCSVKIAAIISVILCLVIIVFFGHVLYGFKLIEIRTDVKTSNNKSGELGHDSRHPCSRMEQINETIGNASQQFLNISKCFENSTMTTGNFASRNNTEVVNTVLTTASSSTETINDKNLKVGGNDDEIVTITRMCWFDDQAYGQFFSGPFQLITLFVGTVIPETIFLIGGGIIIRKLFKSARWRKNVTKDFVGKGQSSNCDIQATQITRTLLLVNVVFFVCTTPVFVFLIGRPFWVDKENGMTETQEIVWAIVNQMYYLNHSTNFLLYSLSGSRFRKLVVKKLCGDNKIRQQREHGTNVSSIDTVIQPGYYRST